MFDNEDEHDVSFWSEEAMARELSAAERLARDRFVEQYMLDYDKVAAALRCGYGPSFAMAYADKFIQEPYVQQRIKKLEISDPENADTEEEQTKRMIRAGLLREAHYRGPGSSQSARVNALTKLGAMYGMDANSREQSDLANRGGVIMVPEIADVTQWEEGAGDYQKQLQKSALE